jgi:hypothetical protein
MNGSLVRWVMLLALAAGFASPALAQSGSAKSALEGVVVDSGGGVIPGATVVVKNPATGQSIDLVTNATGNFSAPALDPGSYTVTVTLTGFKTVEVNTRLIAGTPASLKVTLDVGAISDTVKVTAGTDIVQTSSTAVTSTITAEQMQNLPLVTRNALNFVTFLPGVDTSSGNHSQRSSTIMGLPQSAIAITLDGVNVQDQVLKSSDGFFANIRPQLDLVQEVTVSEATPGADSAGQGAVQIKFVTRSGTNKEEGSAYEYFRDASLNSNSYFNTLNGLPKNQITLNQYGFREGGPLSIPGLFDGKDKLFYFVNYEEFRLPSSISRVREVLSPTAQGGLFQYGCTAAGGCAHSVNLLQLAGANGQTSTIDPTVASMLGIINNAIGATGTTTANTDLNTFGYNFQPDSDRVEHDPGVRVDINLSRNHRLTSTYAFQKVNSLPDLLNNVEARFPGLPVSGGQVSYRNTGSDTLRSTFGKNLVNEASFGFLWSPIYFSQGVTADAFSDSQGFQITFPSVGGNTPTSLASGGQNNVQSRNGKSWNLNDTVNWLKGSHSLQFGESFTQVGSWLSQNVDVVPQIAFGVQTGLDPADALFTTANFPGAANADLTSARALYSLLTGRVTTLQSYVARDPNTGNYLLFAPETENVTMNDLGTFVQDSWRVKPNVTVNAGLRWEVQYPFTTNANVYSQNSFADLCGVSGVGTNPAVPGGVGCNIFEPGTLSGTTPTYGPYNAGAPGYNTDLNNFAPNVGVAWQPNAQHGFLRALLGDPAQATVRASYGRSYNRDGLNTWLPTYEANPGVTQEIDRNQVNGNLVLPGESWPVLLRDTSRLGPPSVCSGPVTAACYPASPAYPMTISRTAGVNLVDPNFQTAYTDSYSLGLQRALSKDMAIEVRYVGTRNKDGATTENWNQINLVQTGFLNEFKLAEQNLQANIAAGLGNTFAYTGAAGTSPLPILLAHFDGVSATQAADPTKYTGTNWTNTTFSGALAINNPNINGFFTGSTNNLFQNPTFRNNALAAGLPSNFWVLNPDVNAANILRSASYTQYDSLQIDLRRRFSRGLEFDANYVYANRLASALDTLFRERTLVRSTAEVPNAFKVTANYDLPFGRGRRFGTNMSTWMDEIAGGWQVSMTGRVQNGAVVDLGAVNLVGMTQQDLQSVFKYYKGDDGFIYDLPQDIIQNTIKAFSTSATSATGYGALGAPTGRYIAPASGPNCVQVIVGDCSPRDTFLVAPVFTRFDFSAKKTFPLKGRVNASFEVDLLNVFNAIDFNPVVSTSTNQDNYKVTTAYSDINNTFDPGGRIGQLSFRINW